MTAQITAAPDALRYILAGRATVTLRSAKTGQRFTYKVQAPKTDGSDVRFVKLLTGADNTNDYTYLGTVFGKQLRRTSKSRIHADAPSFRAIEWALRKLAAGELPAELEIYHEGRCGKCGRKLTVPESIASGLGPKCASHDD